MELEIEVCEEVVFGPDEAEGVVVVAEVTAADGLSSGCAPVGIVGGGRTWRVELLVSFIFLLVVAKQVALSEQRGGRRILHTPMDCAGAGITSAGWVVHIVSTSLDNVDLTTAGPLSIFRVLGHHPKGHNKLLIPSKGPHYTLGAKIQRSVVREIKLTRLLAITNHHGGTLQQPQPFHI